jgi:DNA-binding transcriptional MerR regulator
MNETGMTVGQLARRLGMRPSALRFYEAQGLLLPPERTAAGYRLYPPQAEQTLRFIQRAQRLGFSLADIRGLLQAEQAGSLDEAALLAVAEQRFLALERQVTALLIQRHELGLFLADLPGADEQPLFDRLLERVCAGPAQPSSAGAILDWLLSHTGCVLTSLEGQALLDRLRGRHIHLWQEGERYTILVVGHDPQVEQALAELARLEAECHAHPTPQLERSPEGFLFTASGENAFIFARLFLALEQTST